MPYTTADCPTAIVLAGICESWVTMQNAVEEVYLSNDEYPGNDQGFDSIKTVTIDDYGYPNTWVFIGEEITAADAVFDDLDDGEMGIWVEKIEAGAVFYRMFHPIFDQDDPTFTNGEWDVSKYKYTFEPALAEEEADALDEKFGYTAQSAYYARELTNAFAAIAEKVELAAGNPAHPLNKIKTPDLDENVFDAFEGQQEKAQDVSVSAAYSKTITY
tara:strand:- start:3968 stop:4615 length:648 start_codon:yes stop_codon:yes gene_type:complete